MKRYKWIFALVIVAAAGIWIQQNWVKIGSAAGHSHEVNAIGSSSREMKIAQQPINEIIENIRLTQKRNLDKEARQLVEDVRSKIRSGDKMGFLIAMDSILHRYEGDPNPLILELMDLLAHEDPQIRIYMADILLRTDIEAGMAERALLEIIRSPGEFMSGINSQEEEIVGAHESVPVDLRVMAANVIAKYGLKASSDDVWNLYQMTNNEALVRPLRRLNDPRMINELKDHAIKNLSSIESMKLIGEYRYEDALPQLKRWYTDKSLSADLRFRTLFPLWRITGEENYFEEFAASFRPSAIPVEYLAIGGDQEHQYLLEMLNTARSDQLYKAAMALHLRFHDDEAIKNILMKYYSNPAASNWGDPVLARRLVGSIDDRELRGLAESYEAKYPTGYFDRDVIYKKRWRYPEWEEALFMY